MCIHIPIFSYFIIQRLFLCIIFFTNCYNWKPHCIFNYNFIHPLCVALQNRVQKGFTYSSSIEERARVPEMSLRDESSSWGVEISVENYLIQIHVSPSFNQDVTRQPCNTWSWTNVQEKERRNNPKKKEELRIDTSMPTRRAKGLCQSLATTCHTSHRSSGVVRLAGSTHTSTGRARGKENLSTITHCIIWLVH